MRSAMNAPMAADGSSPCSISCSVAARIDQPGVIRLVPLGDPGVEVPAVVVEPGGVGDAAHALEVEALEVTEADHDVGDLHASVVDVVLDFDRPAAEAQRAHQGVAQAGVAQVADVGGLVGVDGGVLDDRLVGRSAPSAAPAPDAARRNSARSRNTLR